MQLSFKRKSSAPRRPLSVFSKTSIVTLTIISSFWVVLAIIVPGNIGLLVNAAVILGLAGLIATGIRWIPVIGSLLCGLFLYAFVTVASFPLYHLAHPKDAYGPSSNPWLAFLFFTVIVILFWCMLMTVTTGVAAVLQNYTQREPRTPRWFGFALCVVLGVLMGALLVGAFAPTPSVATTSSTVNGESVVHLGISNFSRPSITVSKGSKLVLIDDGTFTHNISTGSWVDGQPQSEQLAGEPQVNHVVLQQIGQKLEIGPFTIAGTFHLYCAIHSGMTLTIIVH